MRPGQPRLSGQGDHARRALDHRNQPHIAGRRRQSFVGECDPVMRIEYREHRGDSHSTPCDCSQFCGGHGAGSDDAVVVDPADGHADDVAVAQSVGEVVDVDCLRVRHGPTLAKKWEFGCPTGSADCGMAWLRVCRAELSGCPRFIVSAVESRAASTRRESHGRHWNRVGTCPRLLSEPPGRRVVVRLLLGFSLRRGLRNSCS